MSALPPLHSDASARILAVAVGASLLLHALLFAWPRWPAWHEAAGGFEEAHGTIRGRLIPAVTSSEIGAEAAVQTSDEVTRRDAIASTPLIAASNDSGRAGEIAAPQGASAASRTAKPRDVKDRAQGESPRDRRPVPRVAGRAPSVAGPSVAGASEAREETLATRASAALARAETAAPAAIAGPATRGERGERSDITSIAQYRIALISASRRFKPSADGIPADAPGGRVDVQLFIAADGSLTDAHVIRSSGHTVLDEIAVEMLRNASAQAPVPPLLLERAFEVEVPVIFAR